MTLYDQIVAAYPELLDSQEVFLDGTIFLQNDSDGQGDFIRSWNYSKPIPNGLKIGK